MHINAIARTLVYDIPERTLMPGVFPSIEALHRVVEITPARPCAAFGQDRWDFSECFRQVCSDKHVINFERACTAARTPLKHYALYLIDRKNNKIRTISSKISVLSTLINDTIQESAYRDFNILTADDYIRTICDEADRNPQTTSAYIATVREFYGYLTEEGIQHIVNLRDLETERKRYAHRSAMTATVHYPDIPDDYYAILKKRLDGVMRNGKAPLADRMTAGIILMDTQMGLRRSEIPILREGMIQEIETREGPRKYAQYHSLKTSRHIIEPKLVKVVCTPLLKKTYNYLLRLRMQVKESELTDCLYVLPGTTTYPIRRDDLTLAYKRVVALYVPEARKPHGDIPPCRVRYIGEDNTDFWIPNIHSIRVHVTSVRSRQGYPVPYTEHMLSHAFTAWGMSGNDGYYSGASKP